MFDKINQTESITGFSCFQFNLCTAASANNLIHLTCDADKRFRDDTPFQQFLCSP